MLEKINAKIQNAECQVSDLMDLNKNVKKTSIKIEDYKSTISSMTQKLESIQNETLNMKGKILDSFSFN